MNSKALMKRLLCCLIGWGTVGIVYSYTGQLTEKAALLTPSMVDNAFHFSVHGIWLYLSFFIFIPLGYLFCPLERLCPLMYSMQLCALISGAIYLLFPTTMIYSSYDMISVSGRLLSALIDIDSPQNLLPSLHVSLTLVVLNALWSKQQKYRTALYLFWAIAICLSVLVLKRHLFIDVVTGAITAFAALYLVHLTRYRVWSKVL
ncbi:MULTISPECIES: phosphatase PAP2 family protein [Providencia]|uniref:Ser/Thr and Tyr protein phosphatase n=1 Tax=Providencia heimbachae ATCC 35613 TaxID=1354272 RepID=A0A1B7JWC1_9GAMM|nr:phosphatase PAP2 family protein [Providencia heimbachae]MBP6123055.1 phosphatase PAP2 family protein [Providencia sp.]MDD9341256.1 phosphatase PAP2 family protein [Providencia heimbachae]NIH24074.1 phosphatase PAP2 family protein [Providencia heimbachae]OAT52217.1 Ser/Thr and Tyr protein phosphatase [Providencia heimbachae ATCC 35613]SQH15022.1 PAP2 superfamily [Providencia heimbachae]